MTNIMKNAKPLFEVYYSKKGLILHMSAEGISTTELIGLLERLKYKQLKGGVWYNTSKQNKKWKKQKS